MSVPTTAKPKRRLLGCHVNHQTHHRGQAHALLTGIGGRSAAPSLDLLLFQRSDEYREMR